MTQSKTRVYFPGLNGLRFIAAFLVLIHHIEGLKAQFNLISYRHEFFPQLMGTTAVTVFFVLSGFLITYLLLTEKRDYSTISIKQFYMRRILRIWPLYFLIILSGFFLFPEIGFLAKHKFTSSIPTDFGEKFALYMLILPNIAVAFYPRVPYIAQSWSIGVEEQFYLIWPILMKYVKRYLPLMLGIVALMVFLKLFGNYYVDSLKGTGRWAKADATFRLLRMTRISCMAIGGIGAYILFFNKERILRFIYRKEVQLITYLGVIVIFAKGYRIYNLEHEIYSVLFIIMIMNIASNPNSLLKLENKVFDFLGKISYGIYMYHPVAIATTIYLLKKVMESKFGDLYSNAILYICCSLLTIFLSTISYYLFEKRFLKLKKAFTKVKSGDEARD